MNQLTHRRQIALIAGAFLLGAILALAGYTLTSANPNQDAVVTVNGEPITRADFYDRLEHEAGYETLDRMISETLVAQAARVYDDVAVEVDEIAAEIDAIRSGYESEEAFQEALERFDMTPERLEQEIRLNLILDKLTRRGVDVTEDEIRAFFDEHKDSLGEPERIHVRHILVDTKEEAESLARQLSDGADFASLAKSHSTDTASAADGGRVGYIDRNAPIVPVFKDAAFALDVGEISQPVESDFGWHLITVDERLEAKEATLEASRDLIYEILMQEKARPVADVIADLSHKAVIAVHWPRYDMFKLDPTAAVEEGTGE